MRQSIIICMIIIVNQMIITMKSVGGDDGDGDSGLIMMTRIVMVMTLTMMTTMVMVVCVVWITRGWV